MGWTKQQLIDQAFSELARAGYVFDLGADVREDALRQLDTMMATWSGVGISIGYLLPDSPDDSNIDDDAGIPLTAVEPVYMNLAVKLAAGRGKSPIRGRCSPSVTARPPVSSSMVASGIQQTLSGSPLLLGPSLWT